jgi:hypothetical protein
MGIAVGSGIALLVGGTIIELVSTAATVTLPVFGDLRPWQAAFVVVALPGLPLALLMFTVREPERRGRLAPAGDSAAAREVAARQFRAHWRSYAGIYVGLSVLTIMAYGVAGWIPEHFRRTYGWGIGEISLGYGLILIVFGPVGAIMGGWMADRFYRRHDDGYLRAALVGLALLVPGYALFALMPSPWLSLLFLIPATLGGAMPTSVATASLMQISPNEIRAKVSALYYFVVSLVGLGLGPTSVALLTDYFFRDEARLRHSLAIVATVAGLAATAVLIWVRPHFQASVVAARAWNGEAPRA